MGEESCEALIWGSGALNLWWSSTRLPCAHAPTMPLAMLHREPLGAQLVEAEAMGLIEYIPEGMPETVLVSHTLPLGAQANPSGAVRMPADSSLSGPGGGPSINDCLL